ncbi:MAG: hypothetical protein VX079_03835 [Pseudomonadota bacterium]|nr:hypothetical protein [Pseudomonadota bacterium]
MTIPKSLISLILMFPLLACQEEEPAKQIGSGPAQLQLQLADLRYEFVDGRHNYFHKRKYTESIGPGVTLQAGKVCVEHGKACLSARVNYRIDGGKFLEQSDHLVATRLESDTITIEYWGKDDAGNDVRVLRKLTVTGKNFSVE